jgi:hypothetical protein
VEAVARRCIVRVSELRSLPDEELMRLHDTTMQNRAWHYNIFLDELRRREMVRQSERMEKLTRSINTLTIVITIATLIGVALTAWSVLAG